MAFWLMKSEPEEYSIDDLARDTTTHWHGVRNYQARNFLRAMSVDDQILFYHSNATPSGIAGLARVQRTAFPDPSQFDKASDFFDPKATAEKPRWFCPEVTFVEKYPQLLPLEILRQSADLATMELLRRGSRLSVQPVTPKEFRTIQKLAARS